MSKKILFIVGDFVEDYEVMVPFQALSAVGHECIAVCPDKKKDDFVRTSIHDFEGDQTYTEKRGHNFVLNGTFDEINPDDFDALILPGGRAPEYLRLNDKVITLIKHFVEKNKPIGAICHAAQLLAVTDALKGKECSAYPGCAPEVNNAGGTYKDLELDEAYVDGNLVSAPVWTAHPAWIAKFLEVLGTKITHS